MNTKTLYFMTRIAFAAMFAMGLLLVPAFNSTGTVSAQKGQRGADTGSQATTEMISRALKLGAASDLAVFAENGVTEAGASTIKGDVISLTKSQDDNALKIRKDFSDSFSAINQLPCTDVADTDLSGKTFGPGIYCMSSARLTGQVVLDGQNDLNGFFIFRVRGNLNAEKGSGISLINDAQANNVHFVADDSATIGEGSSFRGSVYARNSIAVNNGTTVEGRTLSLKGDVTLGENVILGPQQTGVLQICKELDPAVVNGTSTSELFGRVFEFEVGSPSLIVRVVAGQCSGQIIVNSGAGLVITERNSGTTTSGGTFVGGFQLIAINELGQTGSITSRNLPLRQATVTIRTGDATNQTRVQFVNRAAITGVIEICKEGGDSGVDSFFQFVVAEIVDAAGTPITFSAPTGQCTGPITVSVPAIPGGILTPGTPRTGVVNVQEVQRGNTILQTAFTLDGFIAPFNRFLGLNLQTRTLRAVVVEGGADRETVIVFVNRTLGQLKVCKVAGAGIPEFTTFNFLVTGTGPSFPTNVNGPDPGIFVSTVVSVQAGSLAGVGAQCEIVPLTFLADTPVTITELQNAVSVPGNPNVLETRVARITSTSGFVTPATGTTPVPAPGTGSFFFPAQSGAASTRTVTVLARRETTEVEFVNVAFLPVPIKVCKVVPAGSTLQGTTFNFTATTGSAAEDPNNLLPTVTSASVPVVAGFAANGQNGFCDFIGGPGQPGTFGLNSFNAFQPVTITESRTSSPASTFVNTGASSTTTGGGVFNAATQSIFFPSLTNGVNIVTFTNAVPVVALPNTKIKRFRMQF